MSLQVWLPLNGSLKNQGVGTITSSGTPVFKTFGKLASNSLDLSTRINFTCSALNNVTTFSICFWAKVNVDTSQSTNWVDVIGFNDVNASSGTVGQLRWETCYASGYESRGISSHNNANDSIGTGFGSMLGANKGQWYHIAVVVNPSGNSIKQYVDGVVTNQPTPTGGHLNGNFWLGETGKINGEIQDVRIYDEVLTDKQIKKISRGLVLHYPLNNSGFGQENLIKDSVYNATPWTQGIKQRNLLHADKKCMQLDVGSLYNNTSNGTTTIFPGITFESNTQYTLSWYWRDDLRTDGKKTNFYLRFKYTDGTFTNVISGSDPQNKWTYHSMTSTAGKTVAAVCTTYGYGTTQFLLADLKLEKGAKTTAYNPTQYELLYDKKYYRESDGSSWVRIFHHNNPASILFSSSDTFSTGVYKSADAWYDFEPIMSKLPYYEFMVKQKTTSDASETKYRWIQYKNPLNATWYDVEPNQVKRITTSGYTNLSYAGGIYLRNGSARLTIANTSNGNWYGALGCWTAYQGGIPGFPSVVVTTGFIDLYVRIPNQGIEFDTSGFGNNGTKIGEFNSLIDTAKYKTSTQFNGSSYIQSIFNTGLSGDLNFTVSFWIKANSFTSDYASVVWSGYSGGNQAIAICVPSGKVSLDFWNNRYLTNSVVLTANQWYHVCCTKSAGVVSASNSHIYINGQEVAATANNYYSNAPNISGNYQWIIGRLNDTSTRYINGKVSDIRVYTTSLSDLDVLELYNMGHATTT